MEDSLITLHDISKKYHSKVVLDHVNLTINKGESVVFVGHNGTGKSTLLKIISGLVRPSSGLVSTNPQHLLFHYIPEHFPKYNMTAKEYITHMCRLDGLTDRIQQEQALTLFSDFFMESMIDIPMKHLSKGTLQKVGVIQALLTESDVLLLDEPLSGQDADSQNVFINKMKELKANGTTLIMSCHEPKLIRRIGDTVYQVQDGKVGHVILKKPENKHVYTCRFLATDCAQEVPNQVLQSAGSDQITYESNGNGLHGAGLNGTGLKVVRITVDESIERCNQIIGIMLAHNWQLIQMNDSITEK